MNSLPLSMHKKCATCMPSKCCLYFALQIDTPRSKRDFDDMRWYLAHGGTKIYQENRKWYLEVGIRCRFLSEDQTLCTIYPIRPQICREHSPDSCEASAGPLDYEYEFKTLAEFDLFIQKRFAKNKSKAKSSSPKHP
jgi:Fe-S-cluster containining protein